MFRVEIPDENIVGQLFEIGYGRIEHRRVGVVPLSTVDFDCPCAKSSDFSLVKRKTVGLVAEIPVQNRSPLCSNFALGSFNVFNPVACSNS